MKTQKLLEVKTTGRGLSHNSLHYDTLVETVKGVEALLVGDAVLMHRKTLFVLGRKVWSWWIPIRTVPAWEWVKCALGDNYISDEHPAQTRADWEDAR